jgi:hypothetical protein
MKLDFISQPSSKSTLPFAGLQQCQVNFHSIIASMLWSKWMVHEKWSPQWGFEPTTSQSWVFSSALTTRPRLVYQVKIFVRLSRLLRLIKIGKTYWDILTRFIKIFWHYQDFLGDFRLKNCNKLWNLVRDK